MTTTTGRTVAVSGANGLLGRALCEHLAREGFQVRALVRDTAAYPWQQPGIERFRLALPGQLDAAALKGVDAVIHCAYMTRFTSLAEARQVNEEGTRQLLKASREAGVPRFVFISSTSAHAEAESYYGRSKFALEHELDAARDLAIRPGLIVGDAGLFQRMRATIRKLPVVPVFGGGRQVIQTVHIEDLVRGIQAALERGLTGTLTIAEPGGVTLRELFLSMAAQLGRRRFILPLPYGPVLLALRMVEKLRLPLPVSSENLLGMRGLRHVPSEADLERLGLRARSAAESLASLPP
jgi:nucleoside-diphosphate-sugar epimerase